MGGHVRAKYLDTAPKAEPTETGLSMQACSRRMASVVLGRSERTVRRWCDDGTLRLVGSDAAGRALVSLEQVLDMLDMLDPTAARERWSRLVLDADSGDADALACLGTELLQQGLTAGAVSLLTEAAQQQHADAMHWLSHCHLHGLGVERDADLALMWLHRAAAQGHAVARAQSRALRQLSMRQQPGTPAAQ
jgi:hypothetical protein